MPKRFKPDDIRKKLRNCYELTTALLCWEITFICFIWDVQNPVLFFLLLAAIIFCQYNFTAMCRFLTWYWNVRRSAENINRIRVEAIKKNWRLLDDSTFSRLDHVTCTTMRYAN